MTSIIVALITATPATITAIIALKTRQEFETIFAFYDKYEEIISALKLHNGYVDSEFDFIKEKFKELN